MDNRDSSFNHENWVCFDWNGRQMEAAKHFHHEQSLDRLGRSSYRNTCELWDDQAMRRSEDGEMGAFCVKVSDGTADLDGHFYKSKKLALRYRIQLYSILGYL